LLISSKLLGIREWFIIHHADCGLETLTNEITTDLLKHSLETATVDSSGWHNTGAGPGSPEGTYINWLTISDTSPRLIPV
jgi:carbonic anhydrase